MPEDLPLPIRKLPAQASRVEDGPVQFGDDWPGLFIRGDSAFYYAIQLRTVLRGLDEANTFDLFAMQTLNGLNHLLFAPHLGEGPKMARKELPPMPDWMGDGTKRFFQDHADGEGPTAEGVRALCGEIWNVTHPKGPVTEHDMLWQLSLLSGAAISVLLQYSLTLAEKENDVAQKG